MKKIILLLILLSGIQSLFAQPTFLIHFSKNSSELNDEAQQQLNIIKNILSVDNACSVSVTGRADSDGDSSANIQLSTKRIDAVLSQFNQPLSYTLNKTALGENSPLVPNISENNKRENRSVLIELKNCHNDFNTAKGTMRIVDDLYGPAQSTFEVDTKENTTIKTKNGSYLKIPSFAFCDKAGRIINGKVTVNIREFLDYPEMIFSGLTMNSDDKLLQSDGFFQINAVKKETELQLRDGKSIQLVISNINSDSTMQYFTGLPTDASAQAITRNINSDSTVQYFRGFPADAGIINWVLDKNNLNNVKSRKIGVNTTLLYSKNISRKQKDSLDVIVSMLRLRENEDLTARIITNAFREQDPYKINRLIQLLDLKSIRFGSDRFIPEANIYLYKSSTQRYANFKDVVFNGLDFSKTKCLSFETREWESATYVIDSSAICETVSIGQYVINTNRLNYINCDHFLDLANSVPLVVNTKGLPSSTVVRIVFNKIKSIMAGNICDGCVTFNKLPPGESVTLVAYSVNNGEFSFSAKPLTTGKDLNESITLTKGSFEEFRDSVGKMKL